MKLYKLTSYKVVNEIAQLIKLQDYVTRYEWGMYRYPTQYIRLKKENWQRLYRDWSQPVEMEEELPEHADKQSKLAKWKEKLKRGNQQQIEEIPRNDNQLPKTEQALKQYFLDRMLKFQLKWATSTVTDVSFINKKYQDDPALKYFLQRFPDTYLLMYYPVISIKKAPVDAEIILISPIGIEIIHLMEESPSTVFMAGDERTWTVVQNKKQSKQLSPLIALKRTEKIVKSILSAENIDFSIQKTVLSRTNHINFSTEPYNTKIVGKNDYDNWFRQKRQLTSTLKSSQLKAAESLLKHCQTTSIKRPEWEEGTNTFTIVGEE